MIETLANEKNVKITLKPRVGFKVNATEGIKDRGHDLAIN